MKTIEILITGNIKKMEGQTDRQTSRRAGGDLGSLCNSGVLVDVYNKLTVQLGRTKPHPSDL